MGRLRRLREGDPGPRLRIAVAASNQDGNETTASRAVRVPRKVSGAISASAGGDHGGPKLVGAWIVSVDRGPTLPPLKSLQSYCRGLHAEGR